jgi:hypothetical protein
MRSFMLIALLVISVLWPGSQVMGQSEDFKELSTRIPDDANLIVAVNADALFNSPLGREKGWRDHYSDAFNASPLVLPPTTKIAMLGAELDIESLAPRWEAVAVVLDRETPVDAIAKRVDGIVDTLAGYKAVWTKKRNCIVEMTPESFAAYGPVSRQDAGRWITKLPHRHSPFLSNAVQTIENDHVQIRMALDLGNVVRAGDIRPIVEKSNLVPAGQVDAVANLLAGVQGVMLDVHADDKITGTLTVVFSENASVLFPFAKQIVLGTLDKIGANLDEMDDWSPQGDGNTIGLHGSLTPVGLRRFMSLVGVDQGVAEGARQASMPVVPPKPSDVSSTDTKGSDEGRATYRYYTGVARLLDDLARPRKVQSVDQIALWMRNYARKIEQLDTRNVDPEMVAFGQSVANNLYDAVNAMHGAAEQAQSRIEASTPSQKVNVAEIPTSRTVNYGGYRMREYAPMVWGQVDLGASERAQGILQEEQQKGMQQAQQYLDKVQSESNAIKATMQKRYPDWFK